jgi:polar amino acid transport system substrate-binding protein
VTKFKSPINHLFLFVFIVLSTLPVAFTVAAYECPKLKVAGPDQWSPNSYFDSNSNQHEGLGYALLQTISEKQNIPYQILTNLPWKRVLKYSQEGKVDLIVAIYQSAERQQFIEFSQPYFSNDIKIYVHKGREFSFAALPDLLGKKGLYPAGASYGDEFDDFAKQLDLEGKTQINELFLYLTKNTADYAIQEYSRAQVYIRDNKLEQDIVALPQSLLQVPVRMGFSLASDCTGLLTKFKQEYLRMRDSGELSKLQASYRAKAL